MTSGTLTPLMIQMGKADEFKSRFAGHWPTSPTNGDTQ